MIKKLKPHFARYGIPQTVVTDNGPQFISQEFQKFATQYGFQHTTSSPYHRPSIKWLSRISSQTGQKNITSLQNIWRRCIPCLTSNTKHPASNPQQQSSSTSIQPTYEDPNTYHRETPSTSNQHENKRLYSEKTRPSKKKPRQGC